LDCFLDSSALAKRYVQETGSAWVLRLLDPATGNRIYIASITGVEVLSALARRGRGGGVSAADTAAAIAKFRSDFVHEYSKLEVTAAVLGRAMNLAETQALRGYDAVQLAAALSYNDQRLAAGASALTFISADAALNRAATVEGLTVDDPNAHP
jgi:predicted nucleic acid-binding protein